MDDFKIQQGIVQICKNAGGFAHKAMQNPTRQSENLEIRFCQEAVCSRRIRAGAYNPSSIIDSKRYGDSTAWILNSYEAGLDFVRIVRSLHSVQYAWRTSLAWNHIQ